jgi:hypothetical protein
MSSYTSAMARCGSVMGGYKRIQLGCALAIACCLALVFACGVGAVAAQSGIVRLPDLDIRLGRVRVVAATGEIRTITCPAYRSCSNANLVITRERFYNVWLAVRLARPQNLRDLGKRVFSLPLEVNTAPR